MSTDRDVTSIVRSWLEAGATVLPDRVLDTVLDQLPTTPQRRAWWPARRFTEMNSAARYALAGAAVVIVAVVGINLLLGLGTGVGGPAVSPSPSPQLNPSPSATDAFFPEGPLAVGSHSAVLAGVRFSLELTTPGWSATVFNEIGKGEFAEPDGSGLIFWSSAPDNVYSDPCAHTPQSPPPDATRAALAAAVAALPGTDLVVGPSSVTVGGYRAQHVVITIRDDIGCAPGEFYRWYDDATGGPAGGYRNGSALGATIWVWIIDVNGTLLWIDGETYEGADPERGQELLQIVDSIRFG
ncbi:MAG: hypothetical protein AB1736_10065 [Chloroflexota bacterium]